MTAFLRRARPQMPQRQLEYSTKAVDLDGASYFTRGATLTGAADGKQGTFSAWVRIDGGDGTLRRLLTNTTTVAGATIRLSVALTAANLFNFFGRNAAGSTILDIASSAVTASATWRHVLSSWDLATAGARHIYITDVSDVAQTTFTNDTLDYTVADWAIAALPNAGNPWNGAISEFFFHTTYIDLSVTANRRKFIQANGRPADLGYVGDRPLGVQPLIYCPNGDARVNRGSGGNFTLAAGTAPQADTSPAP